MTRRSPILRTRSALRLQTSLALPGALALLLTLALGALAGLAVAGASAGPAPAKRWVAVSVATLWSKPGLARRIDAPALASPADPGAWVRRMSVAQKRWLVGKLETQVLYGEEVLLLGSHGTWSKVAVPSQATPKDPLGYPGWVETAQLSRAAPASTATVAVIRLPTARLWETPAWRASSGVFSYGTQLPVVSSSGRSVEVVTLDGRHRFLRPRAVVLRAARTAWPKPTGAHLAAAARRFLGLSYLWAGTSGFGFDCSGFTYALYRAHGIQIPRDAGDQFARGTKVTSRKALQLGDLVFFRNAAGTIHHVGLYVGGGRMIESPGTGLAVRAESLFADPRAREFAGGRRYLP